MKKSDKWVKIIGSEVTLVSLAPRVLAYGILVGLVNLDDKKNDI